MVDGTMLRSTRPQGYGFWQHGSSRVALYQLRRA
jgi:hypothetical protein